MPVARHAAKSAMKQRLEFVEERCRAQTDLLAGLEHVLHAIQRVVHMLADLEGQRLAVPPL